MVPDARTVLQTTDGEVRLTVPPAAVDSPLSMTLQVVRVADVLPPSGEGRRAASELIDVSGERGGVDEPGLRLDRPVEVRIRVTSAIRDAAGGNLDNVVIQQLDEDTGRWVSIPTRVDESGGQLIAETDRLSPVIASVPGPPPRAGEALAILAPERETVLAPPLTSAEAPPPVLRVNPGTVDDFGTLVYVPRAPSQIPLADEGEVLVGQPFLLEVYKLDELQPAYEFGAPLDIFIPFTAELLDLVGGDPTALTLKFYDESASPPAWTELPTEVIGDGLYAPVDHLTVFSLTADEEVPTPVVGLTRTASLHLSSLYGRSVPLAVGDVVSVSILVDAGGDAAGEFDVTLVYPPDLLELLSVDSTASYCNQPTDPSHRLGSVELGCRVVGVGHVGAGGVVAELTMQAVGRGLATLSFHPDTRVLSSFDRNDILGFAPPLVMAIDTVIPAVVHPEPIAVQLPEPGGASTLVVVIIVVLVVLAAAGTGYALRGSIRRAVVRRRLG